MNQARQDLLSGEWVIFTPDRARRPVEVQEHRAEQALDVALRWDRRCPFCPGNESMLPGVIQEMAGGHDDSWSVRVVPNMFAAVRPDSATVDRRPSCGIYSTAPAHGRHEVIIESARHDLEPSLMSGAELRLVLQAYLGRFLTITDEDPAYRVYLFRNRGARAGTSLTHPHSQLVATDVASLRMQRLEERQQQYHAKSGRCLLCDVVENELREGVRLIARSAAWVAFTPFAATAAHEVWVVPRRHQADFGQALPDELDALADLLSVLYRAVKHAFHDPDFNLTVDTAPQSASGNDALHWHLRLTPRIGTPGGFELASGICTNAWTPESSAASLRAAVARGRGP